MIEKEILQKILESKSYKENNLENLPTRKGFGEALLLIGKNNPDIVALCADLTESTQMHLFKESFPNRFVEIGIGEQNMASVASGLASAGKIPFMASYAMFSPGRNWEQIRTTICYNDVPVKVVGAHSGVSVGPDGGTHQAVEDIALMRVIPNMIVVVPCDAIEAKKATIAISQNKKPTYLRLTREKSPVITDENTEFEIGKMNTLYETDVFHVSDKTENEKTVCIIACGEMVSRSLFTIKSLEEEGIHLAVCNLHTIKPLDIKSIYEKVKKYKNILLAEEHQKAGGMGSAVLEALYKYVEENNLHAEFHNLKVRIKQVGVDNRFGQSGTKEELFEEYNLNEKYLINLAESFFN